MIQLIQPVLFIVEIVLFLLIFILAIYGPRSWLKISALLAFVAGMIAGFLVTKADYYPSGFLVGLVFAVFGGLFVYWTGYWARRFRGL